MGKPVDNFSFEALIKDWDFEEMEAELTAQERAYKVFMETQQINISSSERSRVRNTWIQKEAFIDFLTKKIKHLTRPFIDAENEKMLMQC